MPGWDFAHVQVDVNPHVLRIFEGTFSLGAAQIMLGYGRYNKKQKKKTKKKKTKKKTQKNKTKKKKTNLHFKYFRRVRIRWCQDKF